jgi:SAM-dependent methyltransferase
MSLESGFPEEAFGKLDSSDDSEFYATPRMVTHVADSALASLTGLYREMLRPGGVVVDLMSSWISHLPGEMFFKEVIGHGMNADELAANPRLGRRFVQDLNRDTMLPLGARTVDNALICASIQYLQRPVAVLADVVRILKPGASVIVSFTNRCFPTKAVAIWQALDHGDQGRLVNLYLEKAGFARTEIRVLRDETDGEPMTAVIGWKAEAR